MENKKIGKKHFLTISLNPSIDTIIHTRDLHLFSKNIVRKSWVLPGGKGINVALALAKLGHEVDSFSVIGKNDEDFFREALCKNNIVPRLVCVNTPTRHSYKIIDLKNGTDTELNEAGPKISSILLSNIKKEIANLFNQCNYLVLTGSIPPGISPEFYEELIQKAHHQNIITALDTSGQELIKSIHAHPQILRVNKKEIEDYSGNNLNSLDEIANVAYSINKTGIRWVIVSLGAEGALGTDGTATWYVCPPKVSVVNPIGAGDTMLAGLISAYAQSQDLADALLYSTALATARIINPQISDLDLRTASDLSKNSTINKINYYLR